MANMTLTKTPMPEQDPQVRARNFEEVALGYTAEQAMEEAGRCLGCKKPKCVEGCPSKSGPSTQANLVSPPTVTRQPPHIPVPSTIMGFKDTMVLTPKGSVVLETNFIMGMGPTLTGIRWTMPS